MYKTEFRNKGHIEWVYVLNGQLTYIKTTDTKNERYSPKYCNMLNRRHLTLVVIVAVNTLHYLEMMHTNC